MNGRHCHFCDAPLARRHGESITEFLARDHCDRSCKQRDSLQYGTQPHSERMARRERQALKRVTTDKTLPSFDLFLYQHKAGAA